MADEGSEGDLLDAAGVVGEKAEDLLQRLCVLGDAEAGKATIEGLKSAEGFVRRELARRVNLRNTPQIRFILDQSIEYGVHMSHLIDQVAKADEDGSKETDAAGEAGFQEGEEDGE